MASIRKTGTGRWQVTVKHNGKRRSKTFASIEAANQWAQAQEPPKPVRIGGTPTPTPSAA